MKYGKLTTLVIFAVAAIAFLIPGTTLADGPTLYPGYVAGTVTVGDLNVSSLSLSASGGGFSASKSVNGNDYSLTVQTGDFDINFYTTAYIRPVGTYYPQTQMTLSSRTLTVQEGETVRNDYTFDHGTVTYKFNITGESFNSWYVRAYANKYVAPPAERTYSYTYTNSGYSPDGTVNTYVLPNQGIQLYAYIYIDGKRYNINTYPNYLYKDIAAGETVVIPVDIVHTTVPDQTGTGTIQGAVELKNIENLSYTRIYSSVSGDYKNAYVYDNPGAYSLDNVKAVDRYVYAYTYMNNYKTYLRWPYIGGDYQNNRVNVVAGQTHTLDFVSDTGVLTGDITFTGTLTNEDMSSYYMQTSGIYHLYVPGTGWVRQATYGGYSYEQQYGTDPDNTYKLFLPPGPWDTSYTYAYSQHYDLGYRNYSYMSLYDYTRRYDGNHYNYGQNANITAGETTVQNADYCTGSVLLRYVDTSGGLMRNPRVDGYARTYNEQNKQLTNWSISARSYAPLMENPEVEVHGPDGLYDMTCRAYTEDGSYITFARFDVELECGVEKIQPIGGPVIIVETPEANSTVVAQSVTVSGTATDDDGVASIEVNGISVDYWSTGNPEDPNEVAFSYDLSVTSGENTIIATASDTLGNQSSDERVITVYLPADVTVKPESRNNALNGKTTIFVQLPDGLTGTASLDIMDTLEITATPDQSPVQAKLSDDSGKVILKFNRTSELMEDNLFTVQGKYCPNPNDPAECYTWQGSDTTKK